MAQDVGLQPIHAVFEIPMNDRSTGLRGARASQPAALRHICQFRFSLQPRPGTLPPLPGMLVLATCRVPRTHQKYVTNWLGNSFRAHTVRMKKLIRSQQFCEADACN
jgi:hypothetical protein